MSPPMEYGRSAPGQQLDWNEFSGNGYVGNTLVWINQIIPNIGLRMFRENILMAICVIRPSALERVGVEF